MPEYTLIREFNNKISFNLGELFLEKHDKLSKFSSKPW